MTERYHVRCRTVIYVISYAQSGDVRSSKAVWMLLPFAVSHFELRLWKDKTNQDRSSVVSNLPNGCNMLHTTLLDHVATCWAGLAKRTQHCATRVTKRMQHVTYNIVGSRCNMLSWAGQTHATLCNTGDQRDATCCTNMLHPFGQGFTGRNQ